MSSLYLGCALCEVDANGNILLPEPTAKALGLPAQDEPLFLATHERDQCLVGYARPHLQEIRTRTERWHLADGSAGGGASTEQQERLHRLFGIVEVAPRSEAGLLLPIAMRHHSRIESVALVVGAGDRFEIWNPQLAMAQSNGSHRTPASWQISRRHAPRAGSRRIRSVRY